MSAPLAARPAGLQRPVLAAAAVRAARPLACAPRWSTPTPVTALRLPSGLRQRVLRHSYAPAPARTRCQTVAAAAVTAPQEPAQWPGAKPVRLLASVALGAILRYAVPIPASVSLQAWTLLSIFVSTIAGLVLEPLPVGAWTFLSVTFAVATRTLSFQAAFGAFTNDVIWLIVVSFFFAKGFEKTGLGQRVANLFVKLFGKSTLGLAYGLSAAEALIAPAMPSTTARAGGIFMPIIKSLSQASGSMPGNASRAKLGAFLVMTQFQGSVNSSALFLTAAAQNLLCMKLAAELGVVIASPWVTWLKGALAPALAGLILTPFIMYKLNPPEIKETPDAPRQAEERLAAMGPMSRDEKIMLGTMAFAVVLWVAGDAIGVPAVVAAMMGLCILLVTGTLKWKECLEYPAAWDTLFWFAVLVGMSGQLNAQGVISYFAGTVSGALAQLNMSWPGVFALLNCAYFGLHYMFASQTAHVGALYAAFLAMMLAAGVPGTLAALSLAWVSNLFGSITHFGSGQAAVYYGAGYMTLAEVFKTGALMAVVNLAVWGLTGSLWWKFIGLY